MRKFLFLILAGFSLIGPAYAAAPTYREGIAAVVNNQAITWSEVGDRLKMIMASSGLPNQPDVIAKVRPQILNGLVEEKLKTQEGERLKLTIDQKDIDAAIGQVAGQNKMTGDQFKTMFKSRGIPVRTLEAQIRSQLMWMQVVAKKIRPQIEVGETDVTAELDRIKAHVGETQWLLSEIVLPADNPRLLQESQGLASKIIAQVRAQPQSFGPLARQFSRAAGAGAGGDMGWILAPQLPPEFEGKLKGAKAGTLIGPFKVMSDLYILLVRDVRTVAADNLPSREVIRNMLGMQRLDRAQRQYLFDLQSSSFIDVRRPN